MTEKKKLIFWRRIAAFIIDIGIILVLGFLIAIFINLITMGAPVTPFEVYLRTIICFSIPLWLYFILNDFSKSGSTIGKKILKIHVVTSEGERLRLYQAISRTAIKFIPWEMVSLSFFGFSEDWGIFSITQVISITITIILIFLYIIIMIKMKGVKGIYDLISHTQITRRNDS
ncbi:MAG: RDD family protein [Candidatus Heimdallarchaeota archaeon]